MVVLITYVMQVLLQQILNDLMSLNQGIRTSAPEKVEKRGVAHDVSYQRGSVNEEEVEKYNGVLTPWRFPHQMMNNSLPSNL